MIALGSARRGVVVGGCLFWVAAGCLLSFLRKLRSSPIYPFMEQAPAVTHFPPSMEQAPALKRCPPSLSHVQEVEVAAGLAGW